ncbi:hypothetical protein [Novosphingobium sp.]|uniref:hypothetical protein n=1 Tax=Novosphingobium sp. TaxID=1874826 RepID=UPI0025D6C1A7|nr:hypothetical protein [Novosphingobium sp.]
MPVEVTIVLIVAIIAFSRVFRDRHRAHGNDRGRDRFDGTQPGFPALPPATDPALEREVQELRKRLEVLERIATEDRKTRELSDQIERLR